MSESLASQLDTALKRSQSDTWTSPLPDELAALITAFVPSQPLDLHTKGYVVLSALCQRLRNVSRPSLGKQASDAATEAMYKIFVPPVVARISDTVEDQILSGLSFIAALFEVDWQTAALIFQEDVVLESFTDALDMFSGSTQISRAVAHLLSQASGHKSCRALISSQHAEWLVAKARQSQDRSLRAAAAVALVKLSRGASADASEVGGQQRPSAPTEEQELVKLMKGLVIDGDDSSSVSDAIEGLAYMSTDPNTKELLAHDSSFLKRLFSVVPRRSKGPTSLRSLESMKSPLYGVIVIVLNICGYRPHLTEEEAQMTRLTRLTKTPNVTAQSVSEPETNPLEDDIRVKARGRELVEQGVLDVLTAAVRITDSRAVRLAAGKALLNLIEDKENRGKVLQAGGAKALILIIQGILSGPIASQPPSLEAVDIEPIQALAKLAITSSPVQVFGPNEGALYDAIRPFSLMLTHSVSNLLQRFEALMALTNLSSQGGEVAKRVASADGLMNKVELLMLEEHTLVRRAATELICNLVGGCEAVFNRYGGERSNASKSKLQVLVALCDVNDLPTRLAASGAVAAVTSSPDACQTLWELQQERHRVLPILGQLIDPKIVVLSDVEDESKERESSGQPDAGLIHRGVVCMCNILSGIRDVATLKDIAVEADKIGIVRALVDVVKTSKDNGSPVLRPAAESLRCLLESGVQITV